LAILLPGWWLPFATLNCVVATSAMASSAPLLSRTVCAAASGMLSLGRGRANILFGLVHLVVFAVFVFPVSVP
jgi:hypothetical protein